MAFWDDQLKKFAQSITQESFSSKLNETQDTLKTLDNQLDGISKVVRLQHELSESHEAQHIEAINKLKTLEEKTDLIEDLEGRLDKLEMKADLYLTSNTSALVESRLKLLEGRLGEAIGARYLAKEIEATEDKLIRLINDSQVSSERREEQFVSKLLDAFKALQGRVEELSVRSYREDYKSRPSERSTALSRLDSNATFYDHRGTATAESKSLKAASPDKSPQTRHRVLKNQTLKQSLDSDVCPSSELRESGRASRTESQASRKSPISEQAKTNRRGMSNSCQPNSSTHVPKSSRSKQTKRRVVNSRLRKPPTVRSKQPKFAGSAKHFS
jgi:hypothetical protein